MKVLLLAHFPLPGGGSGIYTRSLAKYLSLKGHEVTVAACDIKRRKYKSFKTQTILFKKKKESKRYDVPTLLPCFNSNPFTDYHFTQMGKREFELYLTYLEKRVREIVEEVKPDIIHVQHIWMLSYIVSKLDIPYVITAHNTDQAIYEEKEYAHFKKYVNKGVKKAQTIITISQDVKTKVLELYKVKKKKVVIIYNGIDSIIFKKIRGINKQEVLAKYGIDYCPCVLLAVGRLSVEKGYPYLIKAARYYEASGLKVVTIIAGEGNQRKKIETMIEEFGLKHVHLIGHTSQSELNELYNIADLLVVPSLIEGFGLVAAEAQVCGTPVVATDAGGLPEIINQYVGTIIKKKSSFELYKGIMLALNNDWKRKKGKNCIKHAKELFSWYSVVNYIVKQYEKAIEKAKK